MKDAEQEKKEKQFNLQTQRDKRIKQIHFNRKGTSLEYGRIPKICLITSVSIEELEEQVNLYLEDAYAESGTGEFGIILKHVDIQRISNPSNNDWDQLLADGSLEEIEVDVLKKQQACLYLAIIAYEVIG